MDHCQVISVLACVCVECYAPGQQMRSGAWLICHAPKVRFVDHVSLDDHCPGVIYTPGIFIARGEKRFCMESDNNECDR